MGDLGPGEGSQDVIIYGQAGNYAGVTTDNRLKVDISKPYEDPLTGRVTESVQLNQDPGTQSNKINYTVPANKVFWIQSWNVAVKEGKEYVFELQSDNSAIAFLGTGEDGNSTAVFPAPDNNPWGPFAAGEEIEIQRIEGDSGKEWAATVIGYLEDS